MSFQVRFDGLVPLQAALTNAAAKAPEKARAALGKGMDGLEAQAKRDAGAKWTKAATGESRDSITAKLDSGVSASVTMTGRGGYFQERGTYKDPPNPVIGPAFEAALPSILEELGEAAGDV